LTGDVVIVVPVVNFALALLTTPVMEPSAFCFQRERRGMSSLGVAAGEASLDPPPKKEKAGDLGFALSAFGAAFGAGLGFLLNREIVPRMLFMVFEGVEAFFGAAFGAGLGLGGPAPNREIVPRPVGILTGAFFGAACLAGDGAGAWDGEKNENEGFLAGAGAGTGAGAGAGFAAGLPKKENGFFSTGFFATGAGAGAGAGAVFGVPKEKKGAGAAFGASAAFGAGEGLGASFFPPKNDEKASLTGSASLTSTGFGVGAGL
jgi:hypothetical protein